MKRYFLIDTATQTVANTILWDGVTPYEVPEGFELVEVTEESAAFYFPPSDPDND